MFSGRALFGAGFILCTLTGCNAIFGIVEGLPAEGSGGAGAGGTGSGASGGNSQCPPFKPDTCDEAYLSDSDNCCIEGRYCQGGNCVDGVCFSAPHGQTVQKEESISVVRSGDYVIWSGGYERAVYRSDTDGDGLVTLVTSGQTDLAYVTTLAADPNPDGYVFFTDYGGPAIGRAGIENGQTVRLAEVPAAVVPNAQARWGRILVHGDYVYWSLDFQATDENNVQVGKHIWRAPREPAEPLPVVAEMVVKTEGAFGIAADDTYLYFGHNDIPNSVSTIERLAFADVGVKDGNGDPDPSKREILATASGWVGDVAVDNSNVYWVVENYVFYQDKNLPQSLIYQFDPFESYVWGVVSDDRDVYITTAGDNSSIQGALWRAFIGRSVPPERLYTAEGDAQTPFKNLYGLTQDCDTVYFVVHEAGLVRRLTK
ncbi:MAG: hypothetical protein IPK82_44560 [Polyangiaceae bacterium]|nr:hypothetical protein [Polyangiaceae bacterium]